MDYCIPIGGVFDTWHDAMVEQVRAEITGRALILTMLSGEPEELEITAIVSLFSDCPLRIERDRIWMTVQKSSLDGNNLAPLDAEHFLTAFLVERLGLPYTVTLKVVSPLALGAS